MSGSISPTNSIQSLSNVLSMGVVSSDHLTPDALFIYMQTRLNDIDKQANVAFTKQQKIGAIHEQLDRITNVVATLDKDAGGTLKHAQVKEVEGALGELDHLDPGLAAKLRESLGWTESKPTHTPTTEEAASLQLPANDVGLVEMVFDDVNLSKEATSQATTTLGNITKQLESSAQLEMIQLQSVMSARQTAIQLCTNLVSALGKSTEAIVGNVGH
jgi:hypothetical protein